MEEEFRDLCNKIRAEIKTIGETVLALKKHDGLQSDSSISRMSHENVSEAHANIMLAYRHLEDSRMRVGKIIQAYDGGISVYDKEKEI